MMMMMVIRVIDDNDGVEDIFPEDEVNINHDEAVNAGKGEVEQGRDVEQVVAVPGISKP